MWNEAGKEGIIIIGWNGERGSVTLMTGQPCEQPKIKWK